MAVKRVNNTYKKGQLTKGGRFSSKKVNPTPIIVIACVLLSFILAMLLGNYLGDKAEQSANTTTTVPDSSNLTPPTSERRPISDGILAYYVDMSGAHPDNSLSLQTSSARESGNALYIELIGDGELIYTSEKALELGFDCNENLELKRLGNHFAYYNDFAICHLLSEFSSTLGAEKRAAVLANESILLCEATESVFSQVIIEFDEVITRDNIVAYQHYLLGVKLACEGVPIGINLSLDFLANANNAGVIDSLMDIADFFAVDLSDVAESDLDSRLSPLAYILARHQNVVYLSPDEFLEGKMSVLDSKGIKNFITK